MVNVKDYNAPNLGLPTNLRAILRTGDVIWGTWCHIPHEEAARVVAMLPHEFCFIDGVSNEARLTPPSVPFETLPKGRKRPSANSGRT